MTNPNIRNLWPAFDPPGPPVGGHLARLDGFAHDLSSRTDGLVEARLEPVRLPGLPLGTAYHFRIAEAFPYGESKVIFTAIEHEGVLTIKGWLKEELILRTAAEVDAFLHACATSGRVDALVRRLMLIASARRPVTPPK
ncbi:hypothetical protein WMF30_02690 [Sorangium sp. So ce134]